MSSPSTYDIFTPEWRNSIAQHISQEFSLKLFDAHSVDCPRSVSTIEVTGCLVITAFVRS
jgi:hypothetical protein